jgi:hypothetical protein
MARPPSHRVGFVKLPGKAKRWRNESNPDFPIGATISDRAMSGLRRAERGIRGTKEQYTKGVTTGAFAYDSAAELRQRHARYRREIDKQVPEMAPADRQALYKWRDKRAAGETSPASESGSMSASEKARLKSLFARYRKDAIKRAMGYGTFGYDPPDLGAFPIAA